MSENLEFEGFEPSSSLKTVAKETLHRIDERAPSQSYNKAVIKMNDDGSYEGEIRIQTSSSLFLANATGSAPEEILNQLYKKIRSDLVAWKKQRFIEEEPSAPEAG